MNNLAMQLGLRAKKLPNGCWEWQGTKGPKGYGRLKWEHKQYRAHRLAYEVWYGEDPGDMFVCHHCDNTSCINPAHLFLGTHEQNMEDAYRKGRIARKLTAEDVLAIRASEAGGTELGRLYGINPKTIWEIRKRLIWKGV
jgi:hypothetical protein